MAQLWCTGPAHIFLSFTEQVESECALGTLPGNLEYLGTAEVAPEITIIPVHKPVYNDLGGEVPFDQSFQGEYATISALLTRWNESVYQHLAARPRYIAGLAGTNALGDTGTLALTEGKYIGVSVFFPYTLKLAYTGMPGGYAFTSCVAIGPDKFARIGTQSRATLVNFLGIPIFNASTQGRQLYLEYPPGTPTPPID